MRNTIVSVSHGSERYRPYGERLENSLRTYNPYEKIILWDECWPPGSPPHKRVHYAFKYYAVADAVRDGAPMVMWLDSACYAVASILPLWEEIAKRGVYVVHGKDPLGKWISDQALEYFDVTRDEVFDVPLCGGAIVGLNMRDPKAQAFLSRWGELAQTDLFVTAHSAAAPDRMTSLLMSDNTPAKVLSRDPRCLGHRSDEACFSLILRELGVETVDVDVWNQWIKSGYNL